MILEIKIFPDEILRKISEPVTEFNEKLYTLLDNMAETMYEAPGYGIAAPQVGVSKRIVVIDETGGKDRNHRLELINPEIISASGELLEEEGCLSIPGEHAYVKRYKNVTVKFQDRQGKEHIVEAADYLARVFQHETDHLDGILFIDKLPSLKKETIKKHIRRRIQSGDYVPTK